MKRISLIAKTAKELIERYNTRSAVDLCEELGIILCHSPMGSAESGCKGFFAVFYDESCITINNRLSARVEKMVLAHELGHAVLHRDKAVDTTLADFSIFDPKNILEREANIFAAALLIDDKEILHLIECGYDQLEIAATLEVTPELVSYKFEVLHDDGAVDFLPPIPAKSSFFTRNLG